MIPKSNSIAVLFAALNALLVAFGQELTAGKVPIPDEWRWAVPLLVAVITAVSPYIKVNATPPEEGELRHG